MATSRYCPDPPQLKDDAIWTEYKDDVTAWAEITDLAKTKQGFALFLKLNDKSKTIVRDKVGMEKLKEEAGVKHITDELDKTYLRESNQSKYLACHNFHQYRRKDGGSIKDYLFEFEKRYNKMKKYQMTLPDDVLGYHVLLHANLSQKDAAVIKCTMDDMDYEKMVRKLKTMFGDDALSGTSTVEVKEEKVFSTECFNENVSDTFFGYYENPRGRAQGARGGRGRRGGRWRWNNWQPQNLKKFDDVKSNKKCWTCESVLHLERDCPHAQDKGKSWKDDTIKPTLFQSDISLDKMNGLIGESLSCGLVDSGCTSTVCGQAWLKCYKESLSEKEVSLVTETNSTHSFRFGKGDPVISQKMVSIPAKLGGRDVFIKSDVVEADIPLLLSNQTMKKAEAVLDFKKECVMLFGKEHPLLFTTSGHYIIPLCDTRKVINSNSTKDLPDPEMILMVNKSIRNSDLSHKEKRDIVKKLHVRFCHTPADKLKRLLESTGEYDDEVLKLVDQVSENCRTCKIYKKAPPRPVVGMPLSSDFNHTVAMDLITFDEKWVLHLIDTFARYSQGEVVKSKDKDVIADALLKAWVSHFGQPQRFLADNGGEFSNKVYAELCERFNIEMAQTAAESPFSNGLCERHNGVLKLSILKTIEDTHCSLQTALCWAVAAKNSLHGHNGYTPNQLVFGKNTNYPSVLTNKLPALNATEASSKTVSDNLSALHSARKEFIKAECSEKIKRALSHNVRTASNAQFQNGEKVYYKRNMNKEWFGPGVVIGQNYKEVIIKHRGYLVRVHCSRVIPVGGVYFDEPDETNNDEQVCDNIYPENVDCYQIGSNSTPANSDDADNFSVTENAVADVTEEASHNTIITEEGIPSASVEELTESSAKRTIPIPKIGSQISYKLSGNEVWKEGFVHSRAGKAGGKYDACRNIQDSTGNVEWYDFDKDIEDWNPVSESPANEVLLVNPTGDDVDLAKQKEMQSWISNKVYVEVPNDGQKQLNTRWVITTKIQNNGSKITKARLVVKGYEEDLLKERPTDSPTCAVESFRICLALISSNKWKCKSLDVKTAFLQGHDVEREIFLRPPKEACSSRVWKLNKCIYGLSDASRVWYFSIKDELSKLNMKKSTFDNALFYWINNGTCCGLIVLHVDDLMYGGNESFYRNVVEKLKNVYVIGQECETSFKYIGHMIVQDCDGITMHQKPYIDGVELLHIPGNSEKILDPKEQSLFRALCGQLNWISSHTRPDVAFDICYLSTKLNSATVSDVNRANKVLKKLKQDDVLLYYPPLQPPLHLEIYCDASYANLPNGASQGGSIVFMSDKSGKLLPLSWTSRKLRRVVKSTLAAEAMALLDAIDNNIWLIHIISEITNSQMDISVFNTDNRSLVEAVHSTKSTEEKRLRVDIAAIKEAIENKEIEIKWVEKQYQLADVFTKQGADSSLLLHVLRTGHVSK